MNFGKIKVFCLVEIFLGLSIENQIIALLKIAASQPGVTKIALNEDAYPNKILVFYEDRPLFTIPKFSDFKFETQFFSQFTD